MKLNDNNILITNFDKILINDLPNNIKQLSFKRWSNWALANDKLYYYKNFNLKELIGEYLCKLFELKCVHYELGLMKKKLVIASQSFYKEEYKYRFATIESFDKLQNHCLNTQNYDLLLDHLAKSYAIDIFMRQCDRDCPYNTIYQTDSNGIFDLAPMYDFSSSFKNISYYSTPHFNLLLKEHRNLYAEYFDPNQNDRIIADELFEQVPNLSMYLKYCLDIDLCELINQIQKDFYLDIPSAIYKKYRKEEQKSKQLIQKII